MADFDELRMLATASLVGLAYRRKLLTPEQRLGNRDLSLRIEADRAADWLNRVYETCAGDILRVYRVARGRGGPYLLTATYVSRGQHLSEVEIIQLARSLGYQKESE